MAGSSSVMPTPDAAAISLSVDARPPRVGIAQHVGVRRDRQDRRHERGERLGVRGDLHLEAEALPDAHDGHAVEPDRPRQDDHVSRPGAVGAERHARRDTSPMPAVLTNSPSAAPRPTTLVSPVTTRHAGTRRRACHRLGDGPQLLERQALLDDIGQR